jgi:hypothetical protein
LVGSITVVTGVPGVDPPDEDVSDVSAVGVVETSSLVVLAWGEPSAVSSSSPHARGTSTPSATAIAAALDRRACRARFEQSFVA